MKIRPLHDRVIVKRLEEERKTASGIVIPDAAAEKPDQGQILAVGPGKRDENGKHVAMDVKAGDRIQITSSAMVLEDLIGKFMTSFAEQGAGEPAGKP